MSPCAGTTSSSSASTSRANDSASSAPPDKLPLEIALRVILDALTGLGALHNLRDARQQPLKLAHGELSPATIALGLDGMARVLHAVTRCTPGAQPDNLRIGYLAPEVAVGDPYDARADVFGAGVLLWEALSGQRLLTEGDAAANAKRVRGGALPRATVPPKAPWAAGLVEVAAKALAPLPDERWPTASVMAAELRKSAGLKLAPASMAAAFAKSAFGERVRKRHEAVDVAAAAQRPPPAVVTGSRLAPSRRRPGASAPRVSAGGRGGHRPCGARRPCAGDRRGGARVRASGRRCVLHFIGVGPAARESRLRRGSVPGTRRSRLRTGTPASRRAHAAR